MGVLEVCGSVASIIGFGFSVALIIRTGNIQNNVKNALNQSTKILAYNKYKHDILRELDECVQFFLDEHTLDEQKPYIQKMDAALSKLKTYHPDLTPEVEKSIEAIRASYNGKNSNEPFGFLAIMHSMNDIIAIIRQEDSFL